MAKEDNINLVDTLKNRGLSCARLKSLENGERKDAKTFRSVGFQNIATAQEASADKIQQLRKKVCKLR